MVWTEQALRWRFSNDRGTILLASVYYLSKRMAHTELTEEIKQDRERTPATRNKKIEIPKIAKEVALPPEIIAQPLRGRGAI